MEKSHAIKSRENKDDYIFLSSSFYLVVWVFFYCPLLFARRCKEWWTIIGGAMEKMDEASFDKDRIDFVNGGMGLRNFFFY